MKQYIDKSAVVAEIERRLYELLQLEKASYEIGLFDAYKSTLSFLDTLEVKEVDLEKEYENYVVDDPILGNFITNDTMGMELAKHFFQLGLKTQKGE